MRILSRFKQAGLDQDLWKWVILAVFGVLAVESAILAWPHFRRGQKFLSAGSQSQRGQTVVPKEAGP